MKMRQGKKRVGKGPASQRSEREVEKVLSILNEIQAEAKPTPKERSVRR